MQVVDRDWLVRLYAFRFLDDLIAEHGDPLPWKPLYDGFEFEGEVFGSLSAVARKITGQHMNGFHFFRLGKEAV